MEDSLYKFVKKAVEQAIAEDQTSLEYFTTDRAMSILQGLTKPSEWDRKFLFNIVARLYIAVYAAELGYRSGIPKKGVYFSKDTAHEFISKGLVLNAEDLDKMHHKVFKELEEEHTIKFKRNCTDGQMAFDGENIFQEMTLKTLVDLIKQAESTAS